jgi:serine/threonine protein kinase
MCSARCAAGPFDASTTIMPTVHAMPLGAGVRLGPYEVAGSIGAGGMGEVYRARDPRLGRDVAIKVLPQHLANDPDALARFEREARAVAALSHPNILAIYDVGSDRGLTYAVMELLEGETLRSCLTRGALPWRDAAEIGAAIADGLATAHAKGIVHRDLKPDNIFLTTAGRPKVLDFGLARHALTGPADAETVAATRTEPGTVLGTVGYMSPEQVRGQPADAPSDMFSLGCVLYEMIAGRRAFARETAAQTMTAILEQSPPPLSKPDQQVSPDLERVIARCLEKHPGARMQSAGDLASALRAIARGSNVADTVQLRSRLGLKSVAGAALSVFLVASSAIYYRDHFGATNSIAILPFANANGNPDMEYLGDGITESLINSLSQAPNLTVMSRNAVFRYKGRETDAQDVGQRLKVEAVLTGRVVQRGDNLSISAELIDVRNNRQLWGEQFNRRTGDLLTMQEEISTEISRRLRLQLTGEQKQRLAKRYTQNVEAYQLYLKGRYY